jgi:hypothetical protein
VEESPPPQVVSGSAFALAERVTGEGPATVEKLQGAIRPLVAEDVTDEPFLTVVVDSLVV